MFVTSQGPAPALDLAFPDVCLTPMGPVLVPVPYPNLAPSNTAIPAQTKIVLMCMPGHNLVTQKPMSSGDNAGVGLGTVSGLVMGPVVPAMGSSNLFFCGAPVVKMTSPTKQNGIGANVPGATMTPSQVKVLSLR